VRDIMTSVNNIVLPPSGSCPFCAFLRGEKPYTILRRSELVAILVTREQRGVSHLLVVPVRHCPTILDLRDEESGALMSEIRHAARIVDAAERRPGIAVWQNNGITANQAVAHVHFHVAGTLEEGGTMWGEVPKLSVAETDAIAERLRQVEASLQHLAEIRQRTSRPARWQARQTPGPVQAVAAWLSSGRSCRRSPDPGHYTTGVNLLRDYDEVLELAKFHNWRF
jgi:histidine triad (HIT) family protein